MKTGFPVKRFAQGTLDLNKMGYRCLDFKLFIRVTVSNRSFFKFHFSLENFEEKENSFFVQPFFSDTHFFYKNGWKEWHEMFCISARQSIFTNCWFPHASIFWTTSRAGDDVSSHNRCQRHNFSKISELVRIPYTLTLHRDSSARKRLDPQDQTT